MGLWNWVIEKLIGDEPRSRAATSRPASGASSSAGTALATPPGEEEPTEHWWAAEGATLVEPVAVEAPQMFAEERALENLILAQFDGHDLSLPPLPRVPELVLRMLSDPKVSLAQVAAVIGEDQVSTAAVLRLANSPLYRGLDKMTAIEQCVVRLGASAIRTLMLHQTMRSLSGNEKRSGHRLAETLSLRAVAAAAVMRSLSRFTRLNPDEAFLIGLLHDIGTVVVLRIVNSQRRFIGKEVSPELFDYLAFEAHQEFGELLADSWKLPEKLKSLIANHHAYPAPDDPLRTERLQLELTDMIGALLGYAPWAPYNLLESRAATELGLHDNGAFRAFLDQLPEELDATMEAYG